MTKPSSSGLTKKEYFNLKEVGRLYKMIYKYDLREQAYKKLLQLYIQFKKSDDKQTKNK